ncbi:MAG: hypothetical protein NT036_04160 [Candidatus Omnitrophica bacterium]|nr:hypothetical protein [Candidatus Omnitrophota bacterium]
MKRSISISILLSALLIAGGLFAQTQGVKPKSVLAPAGTTSFKEPSPEDMAKDNKVNFIDQDEKDCDSGKGERYDIGFILYANWYEKAAYTSRDPNYDRPTYTVWNYKCAYISRFTTRVYLMSEPTGGSKVEVATSNFKIYPKNITGSYVLSDAHGRMASTGAKVGDALGAISCDHPPEAIPLGVMPAASVKAPLNDKINFNLDMTLVGLFYPICNGIPAVTITPFMATLEPDAALRIANLAPSQKLFSSPIFVEEYNRAFFKAPLKIENLSIARLKIGPITRTISDVKTGKGLIGKMPYTTGSMNCSFDITVTAYLKRIQDDGYVPGQPSSPWYNSGEPPQGGEGPGGPGNVKSPQPPEKETPKQSSGKGKAPGLTGNPPETDRVRDVKAKAKRMLDRALRDMNLINKNSSNFLGKDYTGLNESARKKLLGLFIRAGTEEWVTISKSPEYYADKFVAFYNSHKNLESQPFLDVLLTLIIMEYDWSEEGIDKEALAREYLGDSLYKANRSRSQKK